MGKLVAKPKRYIISCRVTAEEMRVLQEIARSSGHNISDLLRQTLLMLEEDSPWVVNG
ncbi:MAG: hydrogen-dependent growth transcriptional repressor [Desulfuromonadales bacterium]|nr:hydrogen-dependent growth transcriptional repressor [Desulfuromonadales bacterium]